MKRVFGVAAAFAVLTVGGCGGVANLDPGEVDTVNQAKSAVTNSKVKGALQSGAGHVLNEFMILCREKPLSEVDGDTLREIMVVLAPELKGVNQTYFKKLNRLATNGCD
ncbi:MAG: hypothetical protein KDB54_08115 [Solirubrobacterales bacterium]|nr:hypothetical protein [Solirubrobacterales bacterium]MCB0860607.1 hypothetical protein [Solirubrobacterales bacterium]HRV59977.1 hypothetical protein [Solirubrobacterales bacterium]